MTDNLTLLPDTLPDVIGIIGSRGPDLGRTGWTDRRLIDRLIDRILAIRADVTIISGGASSGVDNMVMEACWARHLCECSALACQKAHFHEIRALWRGPYGSGSFNPQAGFMRNDKLVRHCQLVIALFAPGEMTPGTSDAVRRCRKYDIPVLVYHRGIWHG